MDGSRNNTRNDVTAVVAREFEPTRIEHELLAQTFDLACKDAVATQAVSSRSSTTSQKAISTATDLSAEVTVAGRRVA